MKVKDSKSFGKIIREQRKRLKYTQQYVSDVTGLSASFISGVENGKKTSEFDKVILLANVLGLDIMVNKRGQ